MIFLFIKRKKHKFCGKKFLLLLFTKKRNEKKKQKTLSFCKTKTKSYEIKQFYINKNKIHFSKAKYYKIK